MNQTQPTTTGPEKNDGELLRFIEETKQGRFTEEQPILTDINYTRIEVTDQDINHISEEQDIILFGLSY